MDTKAYLERIGYRGRIRLNPDVLRSLHMRHLLSIPFENLDIHLGRPIILSENALYDKIIKHHRGGFCYELNGLFAGLLDDLGYRVSMLSARVARKSGGFSPDFDHMTLRVQLKHPGSSTWDLATLSRNQNDSTCQAHKPIVERTTVSLEKTAGPCCLGGRREMVSGSLNTNSAWRTESSRILFRDVGGNRPLQGLTSERAACAHA